MTCSRFRSNGGNTSLDAALSALAETLRSASVNVLAGTVKVDLGLVADTLGDRVRWEIAPAGAPAVHRIRLTLAVGEGVRGSDAVEPGRGSRDIAETVSLDPDLDLPPITRPRPGVREDGDDR